MSSPDVLLISIDALRYDAVASGNTVAMPALANLARQGITFDHAFAGGAWTSAAMPPLLTSTYASMWGGCEGPLAEERPSAVEALQSHGYTTAGFVTNPLAGRRFGYQRGFDVFEELEPEEREPRLRGVRGGQRLLRSPAFQRACALGGSALRPARVYAPGARLTARALEWLESSRRPSFLWLHYMDAHWPYHDPDALQSPQEVAAAWRDVAWFHEAWAGTRALDDAFVERLRGLYAAAVARVDEAIGHLLAELDAAGRLEQTLVVVCADHGEAFGEHGALGHRELNLYDEVLRIPLVVRPPGGARGARIAELVRALDVMPTVLDCGECPAPEGMLGRSLRPLWETPGVSWDVDYAISEQARRTRHAVTMRTATHRWIWDAGAPEESRLYDLRSDPAEQRSRSVAELDDRFRALLDRHLALVRESKVQAPAEPEVDESLRQRLRALGYLR